SRASTAAWLSSFGPTNPSGSPQVGSAKRNMDRPRPRSCTNATRSGTSLSNGRLPEGTVPTRLGPLRRSTASTASSRPTCPESQALPQATSGPDVNCIASGYGGPCTCVRPDVKEDDGGAGSGPGRGHGSTRQRGAAERRRLVGPRGRALGDARAQRCGQDHFVERGFQPVASHAGTGGDPRREAGPGGCFRVAATD